MFGSLVAGAFQKITMRTDRCKKKLKKKSSAQINFIYTVLRNRIWKWVFRKHSMMLLTLTFRFQSPYDRIDGLRLTLNDLGIEHGLGFLDHLKFSEASRSIDSIEMSNFVFGDVVVGDWRYWKLNGSAPVGKGNIYYWCPRNSWWWWNNVRMMVELCFNAAFHLAQWNSWWLLPVSRQQLMSHTTNSQMSSKFDRTFCSVIIIIMRRINYMKCSSTAEQFLQSP